MSHSFECVCSECRPAVTQPLSFDAWKHSLAARLTPTVDAARGIATSLGLRPYSVRLVWTRWSGPRRGVGQELIERELPITPTPRVSSLPSLRDLLIQSGRDEQGEVRVSEISMRYTEEQLSGRINGGVTRAQDFYWEVLYPVSATEYLRRRFTISSPPVREAERQQWVVTLLRSSEDRMPNGTPGSALP